MIDQLTFKIFCRKISNPTLPEWVDGVVPDTADCGAMLKTVKIDCDPGSLDPSAFSMKEMTDGKGFVQA